MGQLKLGCWSARNSKRFTFQGVGGLLGFCAARSFGGSAGDYFRVSEFLFGDQRMLTGTRVYSLFRVGDFELANVPSSLTLARL